MATFRVFLIPALLTAWALPAVAQNRPIDPPGAGLRATYPSEVVTISRFGISPAKIVRTEASFVLFIENFLGNHEEEFSLVRTGNVVSVANVATHSKQHRASIPLNLVPGKYSLRLKNHADLSIDIVINPK